MTREEALKGLIEERDLGEANRDIWDEEKDRIKSDRYVEMLNIAIKALEQELCEDAISRQAVLDQTYLWSKDEFLRVTNPFDYLHKRINSLPPVTPQYTNSEIQKMQELEQAEIQKAYELGKAKQPKIGAVDPLQNPYS